MARGNQSDRNLRNETQAELNELADESSQPYGGDIDAEGSDFIGDDIGANQTGTGQGTTAMRTKATPKTAAQQQKSAMQNKKGNQPPNR
jgi:hypothetical protein